MPAKPMTEAQAAHATLEALDELRTLTGLSQRQVDLRAHCKAVLARTATMQLHPSVTQQAVHQ